MRVVGLWLQRVSCVTLMSGQEVRPESGGPSEPAGNKSTRLSLHTPEGEGQVTMFLVGQGGHVAAEESLGLVVKLASCETDLRHRVWSATRKVLSLELFYQSFFWWGRVQVFPHPPPCACHETMSSSLELFLFDTLSH